MQPTGQIAPGTPTQSLLGIGARILTQENKKNFDVPCVWPMLDGTSLIARATAIRRRAERSHDRSRFPPDAATITDCVIRFKAAMHLSEDFFPGQAN